MAIIIHKTESARSYERLENKLKEKKQCIAEINQVIKNTTAGDLLVKKIKNVLNKYSKNAKVGGFNAKNSQ